MNLGKLPNGWQICSICGEKPVMPIGEADYGIGIGIEFFPDPNPVCEECWELGIGIDLPTDENSELPF